MTIEHNFIFLSWWKIDWQSEFVTCESFNVWFLFQIPCTALGGCRSSTLNPSSSPFAGSRSATTWRAVTTTVWRLSIATRWTLKKRPERRSVPILSASLLYTPSGTSCPSPTSAWNLCWKTQRESKKVKNSTFWRMRMVSALLSLTSWRIYRRNTYYIYIRVFSSFPLTVCLLLLNVYT